MLVRLFLRIEDALSSGIIYWVCLFRNLGARLRGSKTKKRLLAGKGLKAVRKVVFKAKPADGISVRWGSFSLELLETASGIPLELRNSFWPSLSGNNPP